MDEDDNLFSWEVVFMHCSYLLHYFFQDQEVFDIVDFTTASEWECFIAAVEEAIHEWRLSGEGQLSPLTKGQLATAKWSERNVIVKFAGVLI